MNTKKSEVIKLLDSKPIEFVESIFSKFLLSHPSYSPELDNYLENRRTNNGRNRQ